MDQTETTQAQPLFISDNGVAPVLDTLWLMLLTETVQWPCNNSAIRGEKERKTYNTISEHMPCLEYKHMPLEKLENEALLKGPSVGEEWTLSISHREGLVTAWAG